VKSFKGTGDRCEVVAPRQTRMPVTLDAILHRPLVELERAFDVDARAFTSFLTASTAFASNDVTLIH
jgi:hypothetical protein